MRVCILGGRGMLGHVAYEVLKPRFEDVFLTVRGPLAANPEIARRYGAADVIEDFDALRPQPAMDRLTELRPGVIVNCIGIVKQRAPQAQDDAYAIQSITVNSAFPHYLAATAQAWGGRVIHLSTDCVFSGNQGNYSEADLPDARDLYGRSKLLGEITGARALTLRTSMIGHELARKHSLLEWFLAQQGKTIRGYRRAIFSGLTTVRLAHLIARIIAEFPELSGLYHVAAEPISKFDLLLALRQAYGLDVRIVPEDEFVIDRSLDSTRFEQATGIAPPAWPPMIAALVQEVRHEAAV